jgi:hypothetical protein
LRKLEVVEFVRRAGRAGFTAGRMAAATAPPSRIEKF